MMGAHRNRNLEFYGVLQFVHNARAIAVCEQLQTRVGNVRRNSFHIVNGRVRTRLKCERVSVHLEIAQ